MFPKQSANRQRGSALVIGIFIIVVLLLLAVTLIRLLSSSAESVAYEVIGTRAYLSAQTGANLGMGLLFPHGLPANSCTVVNALTEPQINTVEGFVGCQFVLSCEEFSNASVTFYTLKSVGECSAGDVTTTRTIVVDARSIN